MEGSQSAGIRPPAVTSGRTGAVILAIGGFAAIAIVRAVLVLGFPGEYDPERFQTVPDATADVLVTQEAWDGGNPYRPIDEIAADRGVPVDDLPDGAVHFRFPAAFLVQAPLLAVPPEHAPSVAVVVNLLTLSLTAWWVWAWMGVPHIAYALPLLAITPMFLELLAHGPAVGMLTLLLTWTWWALSRDRSGQAAAGIGLLGVSRGFPLLLVPGAWMVGRRRAAWWSAGGFVVVDLVGMALLGVGPGDLLVASSDATAVFGPDVHNASLAGMLMRFGVGTSAAVIAGLVAVLLAWLLLQRNAGSVGATVELAVPAMLLASPLSWPTYHVLYLPWAASVLERGARRQMGAVAAVAASAYGLWWIRGPDVSGPMAFTVSVVALVVAVQRIRSERNERESRP